MTEENVHVLRFERFHDVLFLRYLPNNTLPIHTRNEAFQSFLCGIQIAGGIEDVVGVVCIHWLRHLKFWNSNASSQNPPSTFSCLTSRAFRVKSEEILEISESLKAGIHSQGTMLNVGGRMMKR